MSLPSRDYFLKLNDKDLYLGFKEGNIVLSSNKFKAFNFHSHGQAEQFIEFLKKDNYSPTKTAKLEVYRY